MANEYIIYCDESDKKGAYFSNFYGGALIHVKDLSHVIHALESQKESLHLFREVKWGRVTSHYCDKYIQLMETYFNFVAEKRIKIRIMFTQNMHSAENLTSYHQEHEYFLLYYQFLKHAFGLQYASVNDERTNVRVYLDDLPDTKEKVKLFKSYLHNLSNIDIFRKGKISIPKEQIADIDSREHVILQCLDIVLGAMAFRLNDKHKEISPDKSRRGKRTLAKEQLYKYINSRIRQLYPGFNIECTTGTQNDPANRWHQPYRHWCFKPKNRKTDLSKGKRKV